jgi:hypothetical protein
VARHQETAPAAKDELVAPTKIADAAQSLLICFQVGW